MGFRRVCFLRDCRGQGRRVRRVPPQNRPQRCVKHTEQLVQKIFCTEARKGAANRLIWLESSESARKVIRRKPTTGHHTRTRDDRKFSRRRRSRPSSVVRRASCVVAIRCRAWF